MAGHSKWSKVQHSKGSFDQKRGQLFSKLAEEIPVAARIGGGDSGGIPQLEESHDAPRTRSTFDPSEAILAELAG